MHENLPNYQATNLVFTNFNLRVCSTSVSFSASAPDTNNKDSKNKELKPVMQLQEMVRYAVTVNNIKVQWKRNFILFFELIIIFVYIETFELIYL